MMASPNEPATIVIAGGGIVGLALAMNLKKQLGVVAEIYEKTSTFGTEAGAGMGMYPNGLRVLRDISPDLLAAVREAGYPYKSRVWERHDGTQIMSAEESILSDGENELEPIGIRRSSLQNVLYDYALSQGISIQFKKPLLSAEERKEDGLIHVRFGDGSTRVTKVLFGADGASGKSRSIVAGENGPKMKYTGVTCLMGLANCPREGVACPSSNKDNLHAVFFPTGRNEQCFQFHISVPEEEANQLNWGNLSDEVGKEECRKLAGQLQSEGWHKKYTEPLSHVVRAVRVGFALLEPPLKTWVKGRIALVGDAAHPPVPYVGQGAQQGLEDAGVIVSLLKTYCMNKNGDFDPTNFEKAMKVYQEIRIPRSSQILEFSKSLGNMEANRASIGEIAKCTDELLKGEVLMYGTLPAMMPGAGHDYKDDVLRATKENNLPTFTVDETMEALDYILGAKEQISEIPHFTTTQKARRGDYGSKSCISTARVAELVDWVTSVLQHILRQIVAHRNALINNLGKAEEIATVDNTQDNIWSKRDKAVFEEVCEVIELPQNVSNLTLLEDDPDSIFLSDNVLKQLRGYVTSVASLYRNNPFHNFEHACHVTISVYKLLSKMAIEQGPYFKKHDDTYGITSDPLTVFSCVLSALIHDVDHEGVPNAQLLKEHPRMAQMYKGRCIAESHSIDIAWEMLMDPQYKALCNVIYENNNELRRFRQLVVNSVIATDICDQDMKEFRNARWEKAFSNNVSFTLANKNLKATIGIEHLIQASDVSHTMQPWHVYRQWNKRLFEEMYKAYKEGRATKDPSDFWYMGEIGFFDFYIIPLAKKLKQCQVFAPLYCEECLQNAMNNREEWLQKGTTIVRELIDEFCDERSVATPTHKMIDTANHIMQFACAHTA